MKEFFSYYEILEVGETANPEEIKRAYREKALKYHPDRVAEHLKKRSEEIFKQISEAYEVLSDPEKRKQYDEELRNLETSQSFDQTDYSYTSTPQSDFLASFIRSIISKYRFRVSIIFCGAIFCIWIFRNGLVFSHKSSAPALSPASQVDLRGKPASVSESVRIYPPAPVLVPPAPPRRCIFVFRPIIRVVPSMGFYGGRSYHTRGRRR